MAYDVIRSSDRADFVGSTTCVQTNGSGTQATDSAIPGAGAAFYYLVRAEDACGSGGAGTRSVGQPIAARSCP